MTTSTRTDHPQQSHFGHAPACVPVCVPSVSPRVSQGNASSVCPRVPSPTEGTHSASPPTACPDPCPNPWFAPHEIAWRYPDPNHPSSQDFPYGTRARTVPCPLCGAPTGARCVTKAGKLSDGPHGIRGRLSREAAQSLDGVA